MSTLVPRALIALLLPIVVVILVPYWLFEIYPASSPSQLFQILGSVVFASGLTLSLWCMWLFLQIGRGTLAPWEPTRKLVIVGPYQYVRNPMISGVIAMLAGEALLFGSVAIGILAAVFFLVNHIYFIYSEEPGLEKRFGESCLEYKRKVPRWVPRLHK